MWLAERMDHPKFQSLIASWEAPRVGRPTTSLEAQQQGSAFLNFMAAHQQVKQTAG